MYVFIVDHFSGNSVVALGDSAESTATQNTRAGSAGDRSNVLMWVFDSAAGSVRW